MAQHSLTTGILVSWTKSFKCSDVVGNDAVQLLNDALRRKGCLDVAVHAVLNDTTGKLNIHLPNLGISLLHFHFGQFFIFLKTIQ